MAYPVLNIRNFAPKNRRKALLGMKRYVWTFEQMVFEWGVLVSWSLMLEGECRRGRSIPWG